MKTRKRKGRTGFGALLAALLVCAACTTALAAPNTRTLDLTRTGSVTLTLSSDEGTPVTDGTLTLYRVADLTLDDRYNMVYVPTEAFASFEGELDAENTELASLLDAYVSEHALTGTEAAVGGDGSVIFSDLPLGLYLMVQTTASTGYYAIAPFLVTVPMQEDNAWIYDVNATPKVEIQGEPVPQTEPGDEGETEPGDEDGTEPGTEAGTEAESETESESETGTEGESEEEGSILAGGSGSGSSSGGTLPQTGQLNWPIPVLAIVGALLFIAGLILQKKGKPETA